MVIQGKKKKTYSQESPGLNTGVLSGDGVEVGGDLGGDAGGRVGVEELAEVLLFLGGVRGELLDGKRLAAEPVGYEDAVLLGIVGGARMSAPCRVCGKYPKMS